MPGFSLHTDSDNLRFEARFGAAAPVNEGGRPRIGRIARPRASELTEWEGRDPMEITLSFCFSIVANNVAPAKVPIRGTHRERSISGGVAIEHYIRTLELMQGLEEGDPEPPKLILTGEPSGAIPHDSWDDGKRRWWLEKFELNEETVDRNDEGRRIFVEGTLTVTEVVADNVLVKPRPTKKRSSRAKKYKVKKGDTLQKIANKLRIRGGWQELAKLNHIRDPRSIKPGQELRLP